LKISIMLAAAVALAGMAAGPAAVAGDQTASVKVVYTDLNLSNPKDSAVLLHRLREAAMEACGASDFSVPDYRWAVMRSQCYTDSVDRAVAALNAPTVTRLYSQQGELASR
jgi:UrcA family protein